MAPQDIRLREMVHLLMGCPLTIEYADDYADGIAFDVTYQRVDWSKGQDIGEKWLDMYVVLVRPADGEGNCVTVTR